MIDQDDTHEDNTLQGDKLAQEQEDDRKYPNRPRNHSKTLPFSDLFLTLFDPLQETKQKRGDARKGRVQAPQAKRHEDKRTIIERSIARWRKNVGDDIYPAFRLIIPDRDRDRAMYGLKEMAIAKLLVKIMKIDKDNGDGYNIMHWKLPGHQTSAAMAGDFAGRCYEVIKKRELRSTPGDMTIDEVNDRLDKLSKVEYKREELQLPFFQEFYQRMNAEELKWLIRMILRQMKIGAAEKTILELWHPDAESLFNISSSLKRVCWELHDPQVRLEGDSRGISLMHCFQPQLAAFQMRSMEQVVKRMKPEGEDNVYWIEEKLDGERMQLHMERDQGVPGGIRFQFWSRKGKDYNDLYGEHLEDPKGALTKHLGDAFQGGVQSIILDGEMITWDMEQDKIFPFGHLKTAALSERGVAYDGGNRPLYRIFDCLYLNGKDLTNHTLRVRREALAKAVKPVHRRFEIHAYTEATDASEIEPKLREVVAEKSEGLVLKNPRSAYRLNDRNDDWIKVKPEYMTEFGEALDCVVIGGYYGSGKRGGGHHSSFLCGLRVDQSQINQGADPQKCYSFFKVGGGFAASDYAEIRHRTDGKWKDWDSNKPPTDFIVLGGGNKLQFEKPDQWIYPEDSFVVEVKAASVHTTTQFGTGYTLRFPRFKKMRSDKTWKQALSTQDFNDLKQTVEAERKEKQFKVEDARKKRSTRKKKRALVIQGQEDAADRATTPFAAPPAQVFKSLTFHVMTDALKPLKKLRAEIEAFVKTNGGTVVASDAGEDTICIADRNLVKVASLVKRGTKSIRRPQWLWDQVEQSEKDHSLDGDVLLLPVEMDRHAYHATPEDEEEWDKNVDEFGDSYLRDATTGELISLIYGMPDSASEEVNAREVLGEMIGHGQEKLGRGLMFYGLTAYFETEDAAALRTFEFAGGQVADDPEGADVTHVVVVTGGESARVDELRRLFAQRSRMPRLVKSEWIEACWKEEDRLDEEAYAP